jgi:ribosomal protein L21E
MFAVGNRVLVTSQASDYRGLTGTVVGHIGELVQVLIDGSPRRAQAAVMTPKELLLSDIEDPWRPYDPVNY